MHSYNITTDTNVNTNIYLKYFNTICRLLSEVKQLTYNPIIYTNSWIVLLVVRVEDDLSTKDPCEYHYIEDDHHHDHDDTDLGKCHTYQRAAMLLIGTVLTSCYCVLCGKLYCTNALLVIVYCKAVHF